MVKGIIVKNKAVNIIIIVLVLLGFLINISPINARDNHKEMNVPKTLEESENTVADITMIWGSFLKRFSLKDLEPVVTINQSMTKDFYFPEVNGTIPQINFSVVCKHRLNHTVLLPRFTRVYIAVMYNGTYILLNESIAHRCKSVEWESINFTVQSNDQFEPLVTNGENVTLTIEVGAFFFFFKYWGSIISLDPVVLHPITA